MLVNKHFPRFFNFYKNLFFLRKYNNSPCISDAEETVHPFRKKLTKKIAFDMLRNGMLYKDSRIAVFNKPAGVAKERTPVDPKVIGDPTVYMEDLLKKSNILLPDFSDPTIIKFPERYSSGVMIIASTPEEAEKVAKCKLRAKIHPDTFDKYLVISQGKPIVKSGSFRLAIRLTKKEIGKRIVRILDDNWTNGEIKRNEVQLIRVLHQTINSGPFASLCSVSLSTPKKNAIRLFFAMKLLSPILGDNQFSGRVRDVLGVPMAVDPSSDVANSPKNLPFEILEALQLNSNETALVPHMAHLTEVLLPNYDKGECLVLRAPVPEHFSWACKRLGIYNEALELLSLPQQAQPQEAKVPSQT